MIVPEFWAEARIQKRFPDRQITVRRFGWSDVSQEDAQRHADERVKEAFERVVRGEDLPRREQKVRYNGADGLPIREEIVERFGDCIVTRNSYGARCLNTPDVFFADVDFPEPGESCLAIIFGVVIAVPAAFTVGFLAHSAFFGVVVFCAVAILFPLLVHTAQRLLIAARGGKQQLALKRIDAFADAHPDWHLRIYRTPNGYRVLALHKTFDPRSSEVETAFRKLRTDRTYVVMCQKQNCFRARITAKPWRAGVSTILSRAVWPLSEPKRREREEWVKEYERRASGFAACRFEKAVGAIHVVSPAAESVCNLHDRVCRSNEPLDLA